MNIGKLAAIGAVSASTRLGDAVHRFNDDMVSGNSMPAQIGEAVFSQEGHSDVVLSSITSAMSDVQTSFESIAAEHEISIEAYQNEAAKMGILAATNPTAFIGTGLPETTTTGKGVSVSKAMSAESGFSERSESFEAFDETASAVSKTYTWFYNAFASGQDAVGELFFPTLPVSPDEAGFGVTVKLMRLGKGVKHATTGAVTKFKWKNALRAVVDPSVLRNDLTKMVPVFRAGVNEDKFVSAADYIAGLTVPMVAELGGEAINTMVLKFATEVSLLGISQTDSLLSKGIMNETDTVDAGIRLGTVMLGIDNEAGDAHDGLIYDVSGLPSSNFYHTPQGSNQDMQLDFDSSSIIISADTVGVDGSAIAAAEIPAGFKYRLRAEVNGRTNLETSNTKLHGLSVSLVSVQDDSGVNITDPEAAEFIAAVATVARITLLGYQIDAFRKNCNKRTMEQYIDTTELTELYNIRYRSAISKKYCPGGLTDKDPADLEALINFTRLATMGSAIDELMSAEKTLKAFSKVLDEDGVAPEVLGMGRHLVVPTYISKTLEMTDEVDPGLGAGSRAKDIQATLINYIRDYAARMVLESEYRSALEFSGVSNKKVTIVIATDPTIHRYLTVDGDVRTLGDDLDVKIVSSNNINLRGRIIMGIGIFDSKRNQVANPLNSGNMGWAPEITTVLNMSVGGAQQRVLSVTPRYLHVTHLPVMAALTVTGLPDTLGKLTSLTAAG